MALINNPNMYTGGAVEFDASPHVRLYGQLLAKKQAEKEAFDNYFRDLNKNVNSAGLRNADRRVFDKMLANWQKYGMENRDAIRRREGGADIKFMQDYQGLLNLVAESKGEEEKKKPFVEIYTDPNKRELLDESSIEGLAAHDEPIYIEDETGAIVRNPNRKSFDYSSISFNPKPFDQDKYFDQFKDVTRMELPPVVARDPATKTQTVTTTSVFDKEAKDLMASRAVAEYMNSRSFRNIIDKLDKSQYNDFFKQNYGRDIETPADLAAAYTLKGLQQKTVKSELKDDKQALSDQEFERQKQLLGMRQANAKDLIRFRQQFTKGDPEMNDVWIDQYITRLGEEAKKSTQRLKYTAGGKDLVEDLIPMDAVLAKALEKGGRQPVDLTITADGRYRPIYLKMKSDGKTPDGNKVDVDLSIPISRDQLKLSLGAKSVTPTQRTKEMLNQPEIVVDDPLGLFE